MKKFLFVTIIISLMFLIYCSDETTSPNGETGNYISCTINNSKWVSDGTYFGLELGPARKQLRIYGFKNSDTIEFILKFSTLDTIKPGTYQLGQNEEKLAIYHHNLMVDTSYSGMINIELIDENFPIKAKGTFSFELKGSDDIIYKFQNGKFDSGNN